MSIEDQPSSGQASTSITDENENKINALVHEDCHRTIDNLVGCLECHGVQKVVSVVLHIKWVAKEALLQACFKVQNQLEKDPKFFSNLIIGDEK